MKLRALRDRIFQQEHVNFVLTNKLARAPLTRFMGWFSRIEQPLIRDVSIGAWRMFADLDLRDARQPHFKSLHDCFIRELKPGSRPIDRDPGVMVSPCDAIVGACGTVQEGELIQAKGQSYSAEELLVNRELAHTYRNGIYVTLRLTSSMYHRFHAPHDCHVHHVTYVPGDVWNVNPVALKRVERLFCRNERAVIRTELAAGHCVTLVPVAAVLVASIRLHCADVLLHLGYRGPHEIACDARYARGDEMGWFQHGSTIIVFAPAGCSLCKSIGEGSRIRMGQRLLNLGC